MVLRLCLLLLLNACIHVKSSKTPLIPKALPKQLADELFYPENNHEVKHQFLEKRRKYTIHDYSLKSSVDQRGQRYFFQ